MLSMTAASGDLTGVARHLFGLGVLGVGLTTLISRPFDPSHPLAIVLYAMSVVQIAGGIAIQFRRTAAVGAILIGAAYLVYAAVSLPHVFTAPQVYNSWNSVLEVLSVVTGAAIIYVQLPSSKAPAQISRVLSVVFGISTASFALEQVFYLGNTIMLVPAWLPPGQTFWAWATTAFFALAAIALFVEVLPQLAMRLLTAMLLGFVVLVWPPVLLADPHSAMRWRETTETIAIAGAAWSLAGLLARRRPANAMT